MDFQRWEEGCAAPAAVEEDVDAVTLSNFSDAAFELRSVDGTRFFDQTSFFRVPPHSEVVLGVPGEGRSSFELQFEVLNAITAPGAHPVLKLSVEVLSEVNP